MSQQATEVLACIQLGKLALEEGIDPEVCSWCLLLQGKSIQQECAQTKVWLLRHLLMQS